MNNVFNPPVYNADISINPGHEISKFALVFIDDIHVFSSNISSLVLLHSSNQNQLRTHLRLGKEGREETDLDARPASFLEQDVFRLEVTMQHLLEAQVTQAHQHLSCKLPAAGMSPVFACNRLKTSRRSLLAAFYWHDHTAEHSVAQRSTS